MSKEKNTYIYKLLKTWKDAIDEIPKDAIVLIEKVKKDFKNLKKEIESEGFDVKPQSDIY